MPGAHEMGEFCGLPRSCATGRALAQVSISDSNHATGSADKIVDYLIAHRANQFIALVQTQGQEWSVPARLVIGLLLLFPTGDGIQHLFAFCAAIDGSHGIAFYGGSLLRAVEIAVGTYFVLGAMLRAAALPASFTLFLRALTNSLARLRCCLTCRVSGVGGGRLIPLALKAARVRRYGSILMTQRARWSLGGRARPIHPDGRRVPGWDGEPGRSSSAPRWPVFPWAGAEQEPAAHNGFR